MTTQELIEKIRDCVGHSCCFDCKHYTKNLTSNCENNMLSSAANRLELLEAQFEAMAAERNKAVEDLKEISMLPYGGCHLCSNIHTDVCDNCRRNDTRIAEPNKIGADLWQWRGRMSDNF